jgi:hypothetical protein
LALERHEVLNGLLVELANAYTEEEEEEISGENE